MSRRLVRTADLHPASPKVWENTVKNAIDVDDVVKTYPVAGGEFVAVDHISLQIPEGEFVAIVGRSGSGKTTLLNMLAGIDRTTSGTIRAAGADLGSLSESGLAAWRGANVGLVFQFFQLLPTLTVAENVMLAMDFVKKIPVTERQDRARTLLERVGIGARADKLPATLSGGQQQRAAIARALANDPPLILADEPTGNLDSHTADAVLDLFVELNSEGRTIIVVTHERDIRSVAGRQVTLQDGRIVTDEDAVVRS
ncbi:ABC transporter ATP-binding protein [Nocardia amamiensis]|uniref:ABC transporter ATP-binding protein n=1 Tax=Nocardia amamiensis TaxID=404578 RepID=A0ABS0CN32_9NOCA|nr:ABC transporter ATP-binding protein [Nocardia amamiensis]